MAATQDVRFAHAVLCDLAKVIELIIGENPRLSPLQDEPHVFMGLMWAADELDVYFEYLHAELALNDTITAWIDAVGK
jgi:hypothetical protein